MSATIGNLIDATADAYHRAGLFFGHGTDNAADEAAATVLYALGIGFDELDAGTYERAVDESQSAAVRALAEARIASRKPLAYLTGEAWFAGLRFAVDERVLVPRSPIAELIADGFEPWADAARVRSILEIGTGSGCIAVACACRFPAASVVATDISADALDVARANAAAHGVQDRLKLVTTDLADDVSGQFDIIVTNPPYVPLAEAGVLPDEYGHEPSLGLFSGPDGLDSARRILQDAPRLLAPEGILVLEVGAQWQALDAAFPNLPFTWLEFAHGGEGVAVLRKQDWT